MEATKTIAEHSDVESTAHIVFFPGNPEVQVTINHSDANKKSEHKNVDVVASGIWPGMTATQKTTIKAFMKAIDAVAKEVTPGEIVGEFLD